MDVQTDQIEYLFQEHKWPTMIQTGNKSTGNSAYFLQGLAAMDGQGLLPTLSSTATESYTSR